jgi:hypothetical protein
MPDFIPGLKLGEGFYHQAVWPIIEREFPGLRHTAALIGSGSEILGFDTAMSSDHHWGPRAMLFLSEGDFARYRDALHDAFAHQLPYTYHGYSTNFAPPNASGHVTRLLQSINSGPVNHRVEIMTIRQFFRYYLDIDPFDGIEVTDWLTFPEQKLRTVTTGAVYHDDLGLETIRAKLAYYPHDVWLYLLAAGWTRIGQEEAFVGRTGYVGDDLGSQLIAARLARDLMRAVLPYGTPVRPLFQVVRDGFLEAGLCGKIGSGSAWGAASAELVRARTLHEQSLRKPGRDAQRARHHRSAANESLAVSWTAFQGHSRRGVREGH